MKTICFLILFALPAAAMASDCGPSLASLPITAEEKLDGATTQLSLDGGILKVSFSFVNTFRKPDWSLASAVLLATGAKPTAVYSAGVIRAEIADPDGEVFMRARQMVAQLQPLVDRARAPESLNEIGDFDKTTRLERFQSELEMSAYTPSRFRSFYATIFDLYLRKLPAALVVAFRTEYFLSDKALSEDDLPVRIVQAAYDVDQAMAISALDKLRADFIKSLVDNVARVNVSPAHFGLVPHEYNLPKGPPTRRARVLPNDFAEQSAPYHVAYRRRPQDQIISPAPHSYNFEEFEEYRHVMLDDLPPEVLDLTTIVKLRSYGLLTLQDFAVRVSGPQLMYEVGLTRDQIRDLYYYVREYYGLKLNIGEEFGITLRIFRPEFRRLHPLPKK